MPDDDLEQNCLIKDFSTVAGFNKRWEGREGGLKSWGFLVNLILSCFLNLFCDHHIAGLCSCFHDNSAGLNSCAWGSKRKIYSHCGILQVAILIIILTIILSVPSGAMWALGLVVLLVTVAGVLALLVYVLKWWSMFLVRKYDQIFVLKSFVVLKYNRFSPSIIVDSTSTKLK